MLDNNELTLINKVKKSNDEEALKELIAMHSGIALKIYSKYSGIMSQFGSNYEDILQQKDGHIYDAIKSFDPSKNSKLCTWIGNNIRYKCLNFINDEKKYVNALSDKLDGLTDKQLTIDENNFIEQKDFIYNILRQLSDPRAEQIFRLRFEGTKKMSWKEVGEKMKLSYQSTINIYTKALEFLKVKTNSDDYLDKV